MNARERILGRVRATVAQLPSPRPLPDVPHGVATARVGAAVAGPADLAARVDLLVDLFMAQLQSVRGRAFTDVAALGAWLTAQGATRGVCDPTLLPLLSGGLGEAFALEPELDRARVDDYRFGITRATGAIAETGTIVLTDGGTSSRLAALAPFIHVAVFAPTDIHATVADAILAMGDDPNVIWCTGPSKTADVEGILIEGVHGPGEQVALILVTESPTAAPPAERAEPPS